MKNLQICVRSFVNPHPAILRTLALGNSSRISVLKEIQNQFETFVTQLLFV